MTKGIYKISSPSGFYIGSSCQVEERLRQHRTALRAGRHFNSSLQRAFNKHGPLREEIILVCRSHITTKGLARHEQRFMRKLKPRYNQTKFAYRPTLDARVAAKISKANKGHKMPDHVRAILVERNTGRPMPDTVKKALREASAAWWTPHRRRMQRRKMKGQKLSRKNKAALLAANIGKSPSKETRKLIAEANCNRSKKTRKKLGDANRRRVWTPEARAKCGAVNKGKTPWNKGLRKT